MSEEEKARVGPVAQFAKANYTLLERVSNKINETASERIENEYGVIEKLEISLVLADQISKYTDEICRYSFLSFLSSFLFFLFIPFFLPLVSALHSFLFVSLFFY